MRLYFANVVFTSIKELVSNIDDINKELISMQFKGMKYLLHKCSSPTQRVGVMHCNEMINIKARYELLHNASLKENF